MTGPTDQRLHEILTEIDEGSTTDAREAAAAGRHGFAPQPGGADGDAESFTVATRGMEFTFEIGAR